MAGYFYYGIFFEFYNDTYPDMAGILPAYQVCLPPLTAFMGKKKTEKDDGADGHQPG